MRTNSDRLLGPAFLNRSTLAVAEELLGQNLCREIDGKVERHVITEVEAYDGIKDKACHAHKGKTPRNAVMFGPAGHWYVYLCYGMHWMLNMVTGPQDYPAAVLFRSIRDTNGPGRLTSKLQVDKIQNRQPATRDTGLWLESSSFEPEAKDIERTPRIGIGYAGEHWVDVPYRFVLRD